jgi:FdrA protein
LISKPPAEEIAELVLAKAQTCGKPVIVNFLGAEPALITASGLTAVKTLEDAAIAAARLAIGGEPDLAGFSPGAIDVPAFAREQRYVRGLFSGGTLCYEATMLLSEVLPDVYSNTPVGAARSLDDVWKSRAHTLIDLGDDVFTRGRPHPMIDHRLRNERIAIEAQDPQTAIILLDVVLGYGSHPEPASVIAPVIKDAIAQADAAGRKLMVVGSVCGTATDPQNLAAQESRLRQAGMQLAGSNAAAVRLAAGVLAKARGH